MPQMTRFPILALSALLTASCGGSTGAPVLLGPFVQDFESHPDDGFVQLFAPVFIGNGATITNVANGALFDFSTADGWGFGGCDAIATSGTLMMGAGQTAPNQVVVEITLDPPAARVDLALGDAPGGLISLEARDASNILLDSDDRLAGPCPVSLVTHSVASGDQNLIASVRLVGEVLAWDDLRIWRWSP